MRTLRSKAAYADSPSSKILGNLGLCATHLERDGEAIEAYEKYLKAGAKSSREKKEIQRDLKKLKDRVAYVRVKVTTAPFVVIDERLQSAATRVVNRYESDEGEILLGVRAGDHVLRIEAEGYVPKSVELTLEAGVKTTRRIDLKKIGTGAPTPPESLPSGPDEPEPDGSSWSTPAWIGVAVTGGLGIATGVLAGLAAANKSDYDDAIAGRRPARCADLVRRRPNAQHNGRRIVGGDDRSGRDHYGVCHSCAHRRGWRHGGRRRCRGLVHGWAKPRVPARSFLTWGPAFNMALSF